MSETHFDLHAHSTASDGTLSPTQLMQRAAQKGVQVMALTDHDEVAGLAEAQAAASELGIGFVPGIELSVSWSHQTIHVVGLKIRDDCPQLLAGIAGLREFRISRGEEIARRLEKKNIPGALEGARKHANGNILSRTHFAHWLVEAGYAKDVQQVFRRYLVRNKPGYVPGNWASLEEALGWIQAAGGIAVIAHPARYRLSATRMRQLVGEFRELGGLALEVVSGSHSPSDIENMAQLAGRFELAASAGSDYHGPSNIYRDLGSLPPLPARCLPVWDLPVWSESTPSGAIASL